VGGSRLAILDRGRNFFACNARLSASRSSVFSGETEALTDYRPGGREISPELNGLIPVLPNCLLFGHGIQVLWRYDFLEVFAVSCG